ncbi:MAG TPA: shikimate kinase AroK, partial [Saccharospirillum sp.]|nr:shikimate kinase AroK [Saccharospirillum sp.]
ILIGPMGAGKSTIGRLLSEQLGLTFVDSDKEIEERSGANIPWIFDLEGEAGFRDRESQVLADLVREPPQVLATGGGAILREQNRTLLRSAGVVVYLKTSVAQQLVRTGKDKNRPLLQNANPRQVLKQMAQLRNPLYEATAHIMVDTNGHSTRSVVRDILRQLKALDTAYETNR